MTVDLKCENTSCNFVEEKYFRSYNEMNTSGCKCPKCNSLMKRIYSSFSILPNEIAGYPKGADYQTLGGAVDASKSSWY